MNKTNLQNYKAKMLCPLLGRGVGVRLLFLLLPISAFAQDITGVWKGTFYVDSTKQTCKFELCISEEKGKLTGYSRIEFEQDDIKQIVFRDHKIVREENKITIEDDKQIKKASTIAQPVEVRKLMQLLLTVENDSMQMAGTWITNKTKRFLQATGTASVQRKVDFKNSEIFKQLETLKLSDELSFTKPKEKPLLVAVTKPVEEPLPVVVAVTEVVLQPKEISVAKIENSQREIEIPSTVRTTDSLMSSENVLIKYALPEKVLQSKEVFVSKIERPKERIKTPYVITTIRPIRSSENALAKYSVPEKPALTETAKAEVKPPIKKPETSITKPAIIVKPAETTIAKADKKPEPIAKQTPVKTITKPSPVVVAKPAIVKPVPATEVAIVRPIVRTNSESPLRKDAALEADKRKNSSVQSVYYKSDSLQITLYDNGEIDGDTVSVLLNGKVIIAKQGLNTKPNIHTIYFDANTPDSMALVMYAENLGSIPPNTGLLVVRDGAAVYEVRFMADLSSNAAIILRRRKKE
jgi:hypothetical protein